jgi:hypothetical protein
MRGSLSCASPFIDEGSSEDVPEAPAQPAQPRPLASLIHGGFSGDPSLFAELGIIDADIQKNLRVVLLSPRDAQPLEESFVAGSLFFCAFAFALLLVGKRRFDAVYTIGFVGCLALSVVYFSLSSTFGSFLSLNGQPATIEHRNIPNVDDREKYSLWCFTPSPTRTVAKSERWSSSQCCHRPSSH